MFKSSGGKDIIDQINFCHEMGFTAFEHNGMKRETPEKQQQIGDALKARDMKMGVFVAYANFVHPTFTNPTKKTTIEILDQIKDSIDVAKRCRAKFVTVVPGSIDQPILGGKKRGNGRLAGGFQMGYAIDLLRKCAEILKPEGIVMVLEPLNWHRNHGGVFLRDTDQAYAICRAVDSPSCKILFDIYHQQISEGNLIPNINRAWNEIGYFQSGDNPGRKEPGTGEINYANVFKSIAERQKKEGRDLIIGMEHGNSIGGKDGEQAVIEAYRAVEPK
jgi:hydroxypyruvate isomerase